MLCDKKKKKALYKEISYEDVYIWMDIPRWIFLMESLMEMSIKIERSLKISMET
jgi:hypothetical protein